MSKSYSMYFVLKDIINTQNMDSIYSHTLNCINGTPSQKIQAFGSTPEKAFKHLKTQSEYHAYGISWIEGTSISLDTIYNIFGKTIGDAVRAITKIKDEPRAVYLSRCAANPIASMVKLHDALFNATNCHKNKNKVKVNYYLDTINSLKVT